MTRRVPPDGHHPAREPIRATSVIDPDAQVHGVAGLFVAGASLFPAAGLRRTPRSTLAALAIRLADHLKSEL